MLVLVLFESLGDRLFEIFELFPVQQLAPHFNFERCAFMFSDELDQCWRGFLCDSVRGDVDEAELWE